jgi:hypothetical protein
MSLKNTERIERGSQATPLAEDILRQLQGELSGGLGAGVGPAQRNSIDALGKWITSMQQREGPGIDPSNYLANLSGVTNEFTGRQVQDQADMFGSAGAGRFGSQIAQAQTDLRRGAARDFGVTASGALLDAGKFNAQHQLGTDAAIIQGLGQLFSMGSQSMAPFMQALQLGVFPEEIQQSPSIWGHALNAGAKIGASFIPGVGPAIAAGMPNLVDTSSIKMTADPNVFAGARPGMAAGTTSGPSWGGF